MNWKRSWPIWGQCPRIVLEVLMKPRELSHMVAGFRAEISNQYFQNMKKTCYLYKQSEKKRPWVLHLYALIEAAFACNPQQSRVLFTKSTSHFHRKRTPVCKLFKMTQKKDNFSFLPLGATTQGELWPPEHSASILRGWLSGSWTI
jgi:hypothetical protein